MPERAQLTFLQDGLTSLHNTLLAAAMRPFGYHVLPLPVPDQTAFNLGKEFCSRGQCNPVYYLGGNLIAYLRHLRDDVGLPTSQIIRDYAYLTAGSCGPCRLGTYIVEFRRALREAGFDGFSILAIKPTDGLLQTVGPRGELVMTPALARALARAAVIGDVLMLVGHRLRPYETVPGACDEAIRACVVRVSRALSTGRSVLAALLTCRRTLRAVARDVARDKIKVAVIGEFWAATTEGHGSYDLKRYLEAAGVEVLAEPVVSRLLYMLWEKRWATRRHASLAEARAPSWRILAALWLADRWLRGLFRWYAALCGEPGLHLADPDALASRSHPHYDVHLRGGEGHVEVANFLDFTEQPDVKLMISLKPFGCMPSSGLSDGIVRQLANLNPATRFTALETTGDASANFYSRVMLELQAISQYR